MVQRIRKKHSSVANHDAQKELIYGSEPSSGKTGLGFFFDPYIAELEKRAQATQAILEKKSHAQRIAWAKAAAKASSAKAIAMSESAIGAVSAQSFAKNYTQPGEMMESDLAKHLSKSTVDVAVNPLYGGSS
jgi:hypothetical protein